MKLSYFGIIFFGIQFLILSSLIVYAGYEYFRPHNLEWCIDHNPSMNISDYQVCFTEYWSEYCNYSYPEYCPNNDYSNYDRCLRNCEVYGTSPCPC